MFRQRLAAFGVATAIGLAGCGGGDSTALTKAEYVKQANTICRKNKEARRAATYAFQVKLKKNGEDVAAQPNLENAVAEVVAPSMREQVEELEALNPPEQDREKLEAMLEELSKGVQRVEEEGIAAASKPEIFKKYEEIAFDYGLTNCHP